MRKLQLAILLGLLSAPVAEAATFTVNAIDNNFDGCTAAHCNFIEAIFAAEFSAGPHTIAFAIGTGAKTITVGQIPIASNTTIDGTTQPGYSGTPLIEIRGTFLIQGNYTRTIRGLLIRTPSSSTDPLIEVTTGGGTLVIERNYLGTTATGNADGSAHAIGIHVHQTAATSIVIRDNVIGGGQDGINISEATIGSFTIENNLIGIGADGSTPVSNRIGIYSTDLASAITIRNNTVASNTRNGIQLWNGKGATIEGNTVRDNTEDGVYIGGSEGSGAQTTIGGMNASQRNVLSGNGGSGLVLGMGDKPLANVMVVGNFIGVAPDGVTPRGNGFTGVQVIDPDTMGFLTDVVTGVQIGGTNPGAGNVIAYNTGAGVNVRGGASGVLIEGNSIHSNGGLAIDLSSAMSAGLGPTPNDAGDADTGVGNRYQNYPVLASATANSGQLTLSGTLGSRATHNYRICLYANSSPDPTSYGEAAMFLGCTTVLTDASGNAPFTVTTTAPPPRSWIAATATDMTTNDTSELSVSIAAIAPGVFRLTSSQYPVAENAGHATVEIVRFGGSDGTVSATISTADGSATAGSDYAATSTSVTFADADSTPKTVQIPILNDDIDEPLESFSVALSAADGTILGSPTQAVVTITDDDHKPSLLINDVAVTEGNAGVVEAVFTVTRSGATQQSISVQYSTANDTAIASADFTAASGTLTFAPNETTKTITVSVNGDAVVEGSETFTVSLSGASNASIADAQGIATITDDDATPSISVSDASVTEGNTGTSTATFTLTLSAPSSQTVTVEYATASDTASSGVDFVAASGTITFAPNATSQSISVSILGDSVDEPNERFLVDLSNAANATIATAQTAGSIVDDDAAPQVTVSDTSALEGSGTIVFSVALSNASSEGLALPYATNDGTAVAGSDYTAQSAQTLVIPAGSIAASISVPLLSDTTAEPSETLVLNVADVQATGTIVDDDGTPQLSISNAGVIEGGNAVFSVTLSHPSSATVSVSFSTSDDTAVAPGDYTVTSDTLQFEPGQTSRTIAIPTADDALIETAERFVVTLSTPSGAVIANATANGTIIDDDGAPALSISDVSITEGQSGTSDAVFVVSLSAPTSATVTVNYATFDGTATASDYVAANGTLTFAPGATTQSIAVAVNGDTVIEPGETFSIELTSAVDAAIADPTGQATITNDDGVATLAISDATITEGNAGIAVATFVVSLSGTTSQPVTVQFETANGSATAGTDYAATSGELTFANGPSSQNVTVAVTGDTLVEGTETFNVVLRNAVNATIARAAAVGVISDDDVVPVLVPSISITNSSAAEGNSGTTVLAFTVVLSTATTVPVSVSYGTSNGTATAGSDYAASSGSLTFDPGVTMHTIQVAITGDTLAESDETFAVNMSNAVNATIAGESATGTIVNDDAPAGPLPSISIADTTLAEGNSGTTMATFTVVLSTGSAAATLVSYETANGSAVAGGDYSQASGILAFEPGVTIRTIEVPIIGDAIAEADESFSVQLSNAVNGTIADGTATALIVNDDAPAGPLPSISIADLTFAEGDTGTTTATLTVTLNASSASDVTLQYVTANGTATSPSDYTAASGTVTFASGTTVKKLAIAIAGDTIVEPNETFVVELSGVSNATIDDGKATVTIVNDDVSAPPPPPPPPPSAPPVSRITIDPTLRITECTGNAAAEALFTVRVSPAAAERISIDYSTVAATATEGEDFERKTGRVLINKGQTKTTIAVPIRCDSQDETDETFLVIVNEASGAEIRGPVATATIVDDDVPSGRTRAIAAAIGATAGAQGAQFRTTLRLFNPTTLPIRGSIVIHPAGHPASPGDPSVPYALQPHESQLLTDVMRDAGLQGLASADIVALDGVVPVTYIRVYNDGGVQGSTGFAEQELVPEDALGSGETGVLFVPQDMKMFRFNAGVRSLDGGASFDVEVRDESGTVRSRASRTLPANYFVQMSGADLAGTPLNGGETIVVMVTAGNLIAYGATTDNVTNDPSVQFARRTN